MLVDEVVPTVATTATGLTPTAKSLLIVCSKRSGPHPKLAVRFNMPGSSVARFPGQWRLYQSELCAWVEVYIARGGTSSRPAMPCSRMSKPAASRAAASAYKEEAEAVSVISPNQSVGRLSISATHCSARCSNSVAAGEVRHNMALTLSAAEISSPTMPAPSR